MNYLGIDYGSAKVGLALATGPLAQPLATVPTAQALKIIPQLIEKHSVQKIIIGLPDGTVRSPIQKFANELKNLGFENRDLELVDETLSSHDARQALTHTGQNKRRRLEHAVSAAIILQSWLDSQTDTGHT